MPRIIALYFVHSKSIYPRAQTMGKPLKLVASSHLVTTQAVDVEVAEPIVEIHATADIPPENYLHSFGRWTLDVRHNLLSSDDKALELENRVASLLVYFLTRPNQVLTKAEILKAIWQKKIVCEDSLAVAISHLRKALDDNPRKPTYIKTIPGVGYQFILVPSTSTVSDQSLPGNKVSAAPKKHLWVACGALVIGLLIVIMLLSMPKRQQPNELLAQAQSIYKQASTAKDLRPEKLRNLIPLYREALSLDPNLAEAYLGIAETKIDLLIGQPMDEATHQEVGALIDKALSLKPDLARAHLDKGSFVLNYDHRLRDAEGYFKQSLVLDPKDDRAHYEYEQFLLAQHRYDEAREQIEQARALNPLSYPYTYLAWVYLMEKNYDRAEAELTRIANTEMGDKFFHEAAENIYFGLGDEQKVYEHMQWFYANAGFDEEKKEQLNALFSHGGLKAVYSFLLDNREPASLGQYVPPLSWARYAVALGRNQEAIDLLEQSAQRHLFKLPCALTDPRYDPLRNEPRFQQLVARLTGT